MALRRQNQQSEAIRNLVAKTQEGPAVAGASSSTAALVTKHKQFPWHSFEGIWWGARATGLCSNSTKSKIQVKTIKSMKKVILPGLAQKGTAAILKTN